MTIHDNSGPTFLNSLCNAGHASENIIENEVKTFIEQLMMAASPSELPQSEGQPVNRLLRLLSLRYADDDKVSASESGDDAINNRLLEALADNLRYVSFHSDKQLAMSVALARSNNPNPLISNCALICKDHRITEPYYKDKIQMVVAAGPASFQTREGAPCDEVARRFGITRTAALRELQRSAVEGAAGQKVREGENWSTVARKHAILDSEVRKELQRKAVFGHAGTLVRNGRSWEVIAREYGLTDASVIRELQREAIHGRAGSLVRDGSHWATVAKEFGITDGLARQALQALSTTGTTLRYSVRSQS